MCLSRWVWEDENSHLRIQVDTLWCDHTRVDLMLMRANSRVASRLKRLPPTNPCISRVYVLGPGVSTQVIDIIQSMCYAFFNHLHPTYLPSPLPPHLHSSVPHPLYHLTPHLHTPTHFYFLPTSIPPFYIFRHSLC